MIFRLFVICIVILAYLYYVSMILQTLFPDVFRFTEREITFIKAAIPFYYWIANKKKKTNSDNNKQRKEQDNG